MLRRRLIKRIFVNYDQCEGKNSEYIPIKGLRLISLKHCNTMIKLHRSNLCSNSFVLGITAAFLIVFILSCSRLEGPKPLEIGGFTFGSSRQAVLEIANRLGYDVEANGNYHLYLTGELEALGISWDKMDILVDSVNGIKEIRMTRKNSDTSSEIRTLLFNEMTNLFPKSESTSYLESFTITDPTTGNSLTTSSDYATLFELKDEQDEYYGSSYYILSRDEFSTVIGLSHTKKIQ